jgi:hypothetical protein
MWCEPRQKTPCRCTQTSKVMHVVWVQTNTSLQMHIDQQFYACGLSSDKNLSADAQRWKTYACNVSPDKSHPVNAHRITRLSLCSYPARGTKVQQICPGIPGSLRKSRVFSAPPVVDKDQWKYLRTSKRGPPGISRGGDSQKPLTTNLENCFLIFRVWKMFLYLKYRISFWA